MSNVIKGSSIITTNTTHVFNRHFSRLLVTRVLAEQYPANRIVILSSTAELENPPQYDHCHYLRFTISLEGPGDPRAAACFGFCYLVELRSGMRVSHHVKTNVEAWEGWEFAKDLLTLLSISSLLRSRWRGFSLSLLSQHLQVKIHQPRDVCRTSVGTPVAVELSPLL